MNSFFKWPGQRSKQTLPKEREPTETQAEGKLELTEALRSYAGGAANWAPHRAERGPYTGRGASTVGLFAVTGPAGLVRQSLCRSTGLQILIDPRCHLPPFGDGPDNEQSGTYGFAVEGPAPTSAAPSRSKAVSAF